MTLEFTTKHENGLPFSKEYSILIRVVGLLVATALLLAGGATGFAQKTEKVLELTAAEGSFGDEKFDPILSVAQSGKVFDPFLERLVTIEHDKYVGQIAERWGESTDGLSWTFYLRKGIKFQNGEALTADDVKFSFERYIGPDSLKKDSLKNVFKQVEVVNDYTVRIHLSKPNPYFLNSLYGGSYFNYFLIMPKDYIQQNGAAYYAQHPIGSGPYKVVSADFAKSIEFEAWDGYWGTPPKFKKFTEILVPEESTQVAMLKTGKVDMIKASYDAAMDLKKQGYGVQGVDPSITGISFYGTQMPAASGLPIANPNVRLALRLAVNEASIIKQYYGGLADPAVPGGVEPWALGINYKYWVDYAAKKYNYNPERAKQLIKDAGYPNGFSIDLHVVSDRRWLVDLSSIVASSWEAIGIKPRLVNVDFTAFTGMRNAAKSPAAIGKVFVWELSLKANVGMQLQTFYDPGQQVHNMLWNGKGISDPQLGDLLNQSLASTNEKLLHDTILGFDKTNVFLPLFMSKSYMVLGPRVDVTFEYPMTSIAQVAAKATPKR